MEKQLEDYGIRIRSRRKGNYKTTCPECSATRKKKNDPCLSVTINDDGAVWNCHHCDFKGSTGNFKKRPKKDYVRPSVQTAHPSDKMFKWFMDRGISEETVVKNKVALTKHWFPADNIEKTAIAFPSFRDGELINCKFRSPAKEFMQSKGAEKILYGMDDVPEDATSLIIVEGEIDKLSFNEAGIWNVVSVPDGAPKKVKEETPDPEDDDKFSFIWNCIDFLDSFEEIILATDNDTAGLALREELSRRLGKERCYILEWPESLKDANDFLQGRGGAELSLHLSTARPYPIGDIFKVGDFSESVIDLYENGIQKGAKTGWDNLDELMSVHKKMMSIVTGSSGSGKSEFLDALCFNLAKNNGWKFAYCSLENTKEIHVSKIAQKYAKKPFFGKNRMSRDELEGATEWANKHFQFIYPDGTTQANIDWVLEKAKAAVVRDGIDGLILDPYNCFEHNVKDYGSETAYISAILQKIKFFAEKHDVHVWFVAHPQKLYRNKDGQYPVPTLNDISGSNSWWTKADYGIVVYRSRGEDGKRNNTAEIHVQKVRFQPWMGTEGTCFLTLDGNTGMYFPDVDPSEKEEAFRSFNK